MKPKDYKVTTLGRSDGGMRITCPPLSFVKIEHDKSGIAVTGYGKNQIDAKYNALNELQILVEKWENN